MPVLNPPALMDERVAALQKAHLDAGCPRAELDLSGGIDSAVMAGLLVLALGAENVTLVHTRIDTDHKQSERARNLAKALNCPLIDGAFTGALYLLLEHMRKALGAAGYNTKEIDARIAADPTIIGSIRSCLRAPLGRGFNRMTGGGLRHGTGNEDEDRFLRFYQKGGDGEVDSNPIEMLSKGEVYQLAWAIGNRFDVKAFAKILVVRDLTDEDDNIRKVSQAYRPIIEAAPSPDLWGKGSEEHTDEAELLRWTGAPFTYSRMNVETGKYSYVGTIERVNRFLDQVYWFTDGREGGAHPGTGLYRIETVLFGSDEPDWPSLVMLAHESKLFPNFPQDTIEALLRGARKAETQTRHKQNPNIPSYGSRKALVEAGILTNELPVV